MAKQILFCYYICMGEYMKTPKVNQMFRAFADETRLRILNLLMRGEVCVCDITAELKMPQSKVSRHLAYLRRAGLVRDRKEGLWRHYSLTPPGDRFHKSLVVCLKACFSGAGKAGKVKCC